MKSRALGTPDLQIAPIIFGGNVFGWTTDEKRSFEVLDAFVDAGFNCIDTADSYSAWIPGNEGGESETIIGNWIKARGNRDKIIIATKVGMEVRGKKGLKKEYILESAKESLNRLKTDYIDLYQAHIDDPSTPIEESLEAFESLRDQGLIKALGASNYSGARLQEAIDIAQKKSWSGFQSLQPKYNLYDRQEYESDLEPVCLQNHLSVITYFSLASGFLTGKYRDSSDINKSPRGQGVASTYLNERGYKILRALDEVAEELRATPTQVSLAWLLHRPSVTAPIVSATRVEQIEDIAKAASLSIPSPLLSKLNTASEWESQ